LALHAKLRLRGVEGDGKVSWMGQPQQLSNINNHPVLYYRMDGIMWNGRTCQAPNFFGERFYCAQPFACVSSL